MYNSSYGDDIDEREKLSLGILILEPFSEMNPISREQILIWFFIFYFYIYKSNMIVQLAIDVA